MDRPTKLVGYGIGDFGLNIYWHSLSLVLLFWYVEVVGLEPHVAGWIFWVGLVWDAVSDPLISSWVAANRSRFGVYRPFIFAGSFALGASFCFLFWKPYFEGFALYAVLIVAAILFRTCYTIVAVPYAALSSRLTFDSTERADLAGVRMMFAFGGMLCVTSVLFPLSLWFSGGTENSPRGFFLTACAGAAVATTILVTCFFLTSEKEPLGQEGQSRRVGFRYFAEAIRKNAALRILLIVLLINSAANASLLIPLAFYSEANAQILAEKEVILTCYALAMLCSTPVWTQIAKAYGKKNCWYLATSWMVVVGGHMAVFGPVILTGVPVQIVLMGAGASAFSVMVWALIPDTVEFGQYAYGVRDEGPVFGSSLFVQKTSGAMAGLSVGYVLTGLGYDPDRATQSALAGANIGLFIALVPPLLLLIASFALSFMPMNRDLHMRIVGELSK